MAKIKTIEKVGKTVALSDLRYTAEDIAGMTGMNTNTILRWIREGKIEAYQIGKRYLVTQEAFDKYIADQKVQPVAR